MLHLCQSLDDYGDGSDKDPQDYLLGRGGVIDLGTQYDDSGSDEDDEDDDD